SAAQATVDQLLAGGSVADQVAAQSAVDSANAALRTAQENLTTLVSGGTETQQVTAQAAARSDASALLDARTRYAQTRYPLSTLDALDLTVQVVQARRLFERAQSDASTACSGGTSTACSTAQANVIHAQSALVSAQVAAARAAEATDTRQGASPRPDPRSAAGQ